MAASINALMIGGITASSGPKVTIAGAKRVLCQITSDIRVDSRPMAFRRTAACAAPTRSAA